VLYIVYLYVSNDLSCMQSFKKLRGTLILAQRQWLLPHTKVSNVPSSTQPLSQLGGRPIRLQEQLAA